MPLEPNDQPPRVQKLGEEPLDLPSPLIAPELAPVLRFFFLFTVARFVVGVVLDAHIGYSILLSLKGRGSPSKIPGPVGALPTTLEKPLEYTCPLGSTVK